MKKKILSNQSGITLTILIITIVILAILASIVIKNVDTGTDLRNYNYMTADIELLYSKVMVYYNQNDSIPVTGSAFNIKNIIGEQASVRDNNNYYQIDLSKLYNITLNYGGGDLANGDVYVINERSHEIYYLNGIIVNGTTYYKPVKVKQNTTNQSNTTGENTSEENFIYEDLLA